MDGDSFPLEGLIELKKKHNFYIILDEAHGFGLYGEQARGLASKLKVLNEIDIITLNFSKALAMQGLILGPKSLKAFLVNRCRPMIYSTATPWSHLSPVRQRFDALKAGDDKRKAFKELCCYAADRLNLTFKDHWSPFSPFI